MSRHHGWMLVVLLVLGMAMGSTVQAQSPDNRALSSREDLQALLDSKAKSGLTDADRKRIQSRLTNGDFQAGDRLLLTVRGDSSLTNTFAVKTDQILVLPDIPPISLKGVLRSEIQAKLLSTLSQYLKNPQVEVETLMRLGLLGAVQTPGYYNVRPDVPISEVVMQAGGMANNADFAKTTVVRGTNEVYTKEAIRKAMAAGMSLDQLGLQGGDEIVVGRQSGGFGTAVPIIGALAATLLAIIAVATQL